MAKPGYTVRNSAHTTRWLTNAMKSIGASYGSTISTIAPNLTEVVSSGAKTATQVARSVRSNKASTERIGDALSSNKYVKFAQTAYRNALVDIKSGNFNNTDRELSGEGISDAVEEAVGGLSFGDDGADNVNVNVINSGNDAALGGLQNQIQAQAEANVKMQKASMDAMIAVNSASIQQIGQIGSEIVGQLTSMNSNLSAIVQYQNSSMSKFIEASMAYYEKVGNHVTSQESNDKITANDVLHSSTKGGINMGRYKSMVKQQFKDMVDNSEFGIVKTLLEDDTFIQMAVNNPIGFMSRGLTSYMMPKILKSTLESMETTFNNAMPDILMQIADLSKSEAPGFAGTLQRAIGDIFGLKVKRKNDFTEARINRDAIPFDGETKHAITEVITKQLREQTVYLQIIAEHYKHNAKTQAKNESEVWDWGKQGYIRAGDITSSITDKMMSTVVDSMSSTFFGQNLEGAINAQKTEKGKNDVKSTIHELYALMEQQTSHLTLGDMIQLIEKTNGSKEAKKVVNKWIKEMHNKNPEDFNNRSTAQLSAQNAMKELREDMIKNPQYYHLFDSEYANSENVDEVFNKLMFPVDENGKRIKRSTSNREFSKRTAEDYKPASRVSKAANSKSYSESGKTDWGKTISASLSNAGGHFNGMLNSIMSGDPFGVLQQRSELLVDQVKILGGDVKKALFGEKEKDTNAMKGGIFSGVASGFNDLVSNLKYKINGKAYTDSKGKTHQDTDDTVIGRLSQAGDAIKDRFMFKIFGKSKGEDGSYEKTGEGVIDQIGAGFKQVANTFKEFVFGEEGDRNNQGLLKNVKQAWQKGFYGQRKKGSTKGEESISDTDLFGRAALTTSAGGLLGFMVGGPVVGALAGLATSVYKNSDRFKTMLFGEEDGLTLADGSKTRKQGLFGVVGNYLKSGILEPMKHEVQYLANDALTTLKHDILAPVAFTAEYAAGKLGTFFGGIGDSVKEGVDSLGGLLGSTLSKMFPNVVNTGGNLLTKGIDAIYKAGATIVKSPFKLMAATIKALGIGDKIKQILDPVAKLISTGVNGVFDFTKSIIKDTLGRGLLGIKDVAGKVKSGVSKVGAKIADTRIGKFANKVKDQYSKLDSLNSTNDRIITELTNGKFTEDSEEARQWLVENNPEGLSKLKDTLGTRMVLNKRKGQVARAENKQFKMMSRQRDKNAQKIAKWTKGQFGEDSEEARQWLAQHMPDKLKELDTSANSFKYFQERDKKAKEAKNGISSKGMSERQLAAAPISKLSEQGQTNAFLAKIFDILFKKMDPEGHEEDQAKQEAEEEENRGPKNGDRRRKLGADLKSVTEEEYDETTGTWKQVKGKVKGNLNSDDTAGERQKEYDDLYHKNFGHTRNTLKKYGNLIKSAFSKKTEEEATIDSSNLNGKVISMINQDIPIASIAEQLGVEESVVKSIKRHYLSQKGRQHALGGFLKKGLNLVGEKGAEIVNTITGKVSTADETKAILESSSEHSSDEGRIRRKIGIRNLFSRAKDSKEREEAGTEMASIAHEEDTDMRSDSKKSAFDKAKDAASLMKEKAEEKYREAMLAATERIGAASERNATATEKHSFDWSKIFSKKGLITGLVVAGAAAIIKYFPGVVKALGNIIGGIARGISWLFSKKKPQEDNENGESAGEIIKDIAENAASGNILQLQEDGSASSLTEPMAKVLGRTGMNIFHGFMNQKILGSPTILGKAGKWLEHIPVLGKFAKISNIEKGIGANIEKGTSFVQNMGSKFANSELGQKIIGKSDWAKMGAGSSVKFLDDGTRAISSSAAKQLYGEGADAALALAQDGFTVVDDTSKGLTRLGEKVADSKAGQMVSSAKTTIKEGLSGVASSLDKKITAKLATETVEEGAEGAAKSGREVLKKWIGKFYTAIKSKFSSKVGSELSEKATKTVTQQALDKAIDKLSNSAIIGLIAKITGKETAQVASAAVSFGISEAIFATIGAINGVSGTAKLFKCKSEDVDGTMRLVSGIIGAFTGTMVGSVIDIIFAVLSAAMGIDILNGIAVWMYNGIVGGDSEKAQKLAESQDEFYAGYQEERDAKVAEQYETQKKAGLIGDDVTLDQFTEGINDGTYKAKYEGFDNYNTRVNASWGDKIISGVGKTVKSASFGISKGWQKLVTGEKTLVDSNGNVYTKNKDGSYQVKSADGEDLGYVSKDAIPSDATEQRSDSLLKKAGNGIVNGAKSVGSTIVKGAKAGFEKTKEFAVNLGSKLGNIGSSVLSYIKGETDDIDLSDGDEETSVVTKTLSGALKMYAFLPRGVVSVGKSIGKFIGTASDKIRNIFSKISGPTASYIKGDTDNIDLGCPEDNPGKPIIHGIEKMLEFGTTIPRGVVWLGKTIGSFIGSAVDAAKQTIPTMVDQGKSFVMGDTDSIQLTDESGISPLGVLGAVEQFYLTVPRGIVKIGKTIGSFIGSAVDAAKQTIPIMVEQGKSFVLGDTDSIELTDESGISPLGVLGAVEQHLLSLPRGVVHVFKSIGSFIGGAVDAAKQTIPTMVDQGKSFVMGDSDDIELTDESGISPLGVLGAVEKFALTPARGIVHVFKGIKDFFGDIGSAGADLASAAKSYISGDSDSIKIDVSEDNVLHPVASTMSKILQTVLTPVRWVAKVFGTIGDVVDGIKDKVTTVTDAVGDKIDSAKTWVSDKVSGVTNSISGAWNYLTGKGGNGPGQQLNGSTFYSQADPRWRNKNYGNDGATMFDSGCGPAAAAMALSDVTGHQVTPTSMADLAVRTGNRDMTGTNSNFMNQASNSMGISSTQVIGPDAYNLSSALDSGNPVVLLGNNGGYGKNPYTDSGHYVVAVGKDANGNVIINDPRGASYSGKYNINDVANTTGSMWSFGGNGKRRRKSILGGRGPSKDWLSIVKACKQSIGNQKKGYSQSGYIDVNVNGETRNTRRDCSGFVSVCLSFYTGTKILTSSYGFMSGSDVASYLKNAGFSKINWPGWSAVKAGDIFVKNGHVEICAQDGSQRVYNCGSNSSCNDPGITGTGHSGGYTYIWRPGQPGTGGMDYTVGNAPVSGSTDTGSTSSSTTSAPTSVIGAIGSFMSSFASKALNGMLTGNYNTDYSDVFGGVSSSSGSYDSGSSSGSYVDAGSVTNGSGKEAAKQIYQYFTKNGYSPAAAAGILGNGQQESGLDPACGKSESAVAHGIWQWESGRFNGLKNYASSTGTPWYTLKPQMEYLLKELSDPSVAYFGKKATYGSNVGHGAAGKTNWEVAGTSMATLDQFKKSTSPETAARQFEAAVERASWPRMDKRVAYANAWYNEFNNGGNGIGKRKYAPKSTNNVVLGGRGAVADYTSTNTISSQNASNHFNAGVNATNYVSNTKNSSAQDILMKCVNILAEIASNTGATSSKLDLLKNLSNNSSVNVMTNNISSGSKPSSEAKSFKSSSSADSTAKRIAQGGY